MGEPSGAPALLASVENWLISEEFEANSLRFSVYGGETCLAKHPGATVIVGSGTRRGKTLGWVLEVTDGEGVIDSVQISPWGITTDHRSAAALAGSLGAPLSSVLLERALRHKAGLGKDKNSLSPEKSLRAFTQARLWKWILWTYCVTEILILIKTNARVSNISQALTLALMPVIWGAIPIAGAACWLGFHRFNLEASRSGLLTLWLIYVAFAAYRLLAQDI